MKEDKVESILYTWLEGYGVQCWFNRKNRYTENVFKTKLTQKKPDFIIKNRFGDYFAIEIKNGDISKNIYDAGKIINYLNDYKEKKIEYYIENKLITIKAFLIATQYSPLGKLFNETRSELPQDKWQKMCSKYGNEPKKEYCRSKQLVRNLWSQWRRTREKNEPGLGVLLSNTLDTEFDNHPKILLQLYYFNKFKNQSRWNVKWITL